MGFFVVNVDGNLCLFLKFCLFYHIDVSAVINISVTERHTVLIHNVSFYFLLCRE